ncbi:MAG: BPSS1780 family membrane protein, partial [Nitrosomonas sp.]|nr:BPSS1780 family membrane protein [Nitrosomonas sp.]
MEVHQVKARQGLQWIMSGFYLFRMAAAAWILLTFTLILIAMSLALIPLLGQFIFTLISPVFLAGLMLGCRGLEQGEKLDLSCLFVAFKTNSAPLITIGGIYLIGQVLIVGVVMLIGGTVMVDMLLYGKRVDESELM